ncbi:hypothetical protein AFLA_009137 [Aspergillus flavus NRRL3357]|nr:hypothetical protein AFLA_009137 [Aspergillus flavus NRRL3357]
MLTALTCSTINGQTFSPLSAPPSKQIHQHCVSAQDIFADRPRPPLFLLFHSRLDSQGGPLIVPCRHKFP